MKKLIALILMIALLVTAAGCAGGNTEPTDNETTPTKSEGTEASDPTSPQQTENTAPTEPEKVTFYLLERTSIFEYGYQIYSYDENYNIIGIETFSLEEGALSITAISEHSGFSNPYHFGRMFKEHTGVTPAEYRKENVIVKI